MSRFHLATCLLLASASPAIADPTGLTFRAPLDKDFDAEVAGGERRPNFRSGVSIVADGANGGAARWADDGYVAWTAPGNIAAARGTLSFFWRPREPLGEAPFAIFRVGFADHSSWDMAFLGQRRRRRHAARARRAVRRAKPRREFSRAA